MHCNNSKSQPKFICQTTHFPSWCFTKNTTWMKKVLYWNKNDVKTNKLNWSSILGCCKRERKNSHQFSLLLMKMWDFNFKYLFDIYIKEISWTLCFCEYHKFSNCNWSWLNKIVFRLMWILLMIWFLLD